MKRILEFIIQLFRFHKLKMLTVIGSSIGVMLLLFPFSDLTDLLTQKVMEATKNQVLLQVDKLDLGFFPTPSINGEGVTVDVGTWPTIEAKKLSISPSMFSLISLSTGSPPTALRVSVDADGFLGGKFYIFHKPDGTNDEGAKKNHVTIKAESIQLGEIQKFVDSPIAFEGKANLDTDFSFFPAFDGQPEGEVHVTSRALKIPPGNIPTQFGPIPMPGVSWSQFLLKARMAASNLYIDDLAFGAAKDPMSGRVKGQMNVKVDRNGPILGAYDLKVELNVTTAAERDLDTLLVLLKDFRSQTPSGGKYLFRVSANGMYSQPNLGRLQSF